MAKVFVEAQIGSKKVVVFSKTYCPYCRMAKSALKDVGADFLCIELDDRDDGDAIQDVLKEMTGARSVPRVFIDKKCIGGGSETKALKDSGKLKAMI